MIEIPTTSSAGFNAGELTEHITRPPSTCQSLTALALHNIKLKIMLTILTVYEFLFCILIRMFCYLFGWEMRHLHTGGSCPVVSGQGGVIMTGLGSLAGRVAQCCEAMPNFSICFCNFEQKPAIVTVCTHFISNRFLYIVI